MVVCLSMSTGPAATSLSCPIHNCVSTNWRTSRTKSRNCCAALQPRAKIDMDKIDPLHAKDSRLQQSAGSPSSFLSHSDPVEHASRKELPGCAGFGDNYSLPWF